MVTFDAMYNHPYVVHNEWEDLVIFNYSKGCTYDRAWDEVTMAARGIIYNRVTKELVARPFLKFFNLGEAVESSFGNIPDGPFSATVKMDGSLGIVFPYRNQYWVATRGSFQSDQAKWATEWLRKNVRTSEFLQGWTYLFEIIYKENKIVIDYFDFEGMVLLSMIHTESGNEMPYQGVSWGANQIGVTVVKQETGFKNLEDLYRYCKALPMSQEGFEQLV